jgi:hypothetical protein
MVVIVIVHGHVYVHLGGEVHDVEVVIIVHTSLHEIACMGHAFQEIYHYSPNVIGR